MLRGTSALKKDERTSIAYSSNLMLNHEPNGRMIVPPTTTFLPSLSTMVAQLAFTSSSETLELVKMSMFLFYYLVISSSFLTFQLRSAFLKVPSSVAGPRNTLASTWSVYALAKLSSKMTCSFFERSLLVTLLIMVLK